MKMTKVQIITLSFLGMLVISIQVLGVTYGGICTGASMVIAGVVIAVFRFKQIGHRGRFVYYARQGGKRYEQYCEYIKRVDHGEDAMIIGPQYVVLSMGLYVKLLKKYYNPSAEFKKMSDKFYRDPESFSTKGVDRNEY